MYTLVTGGTGFVGRHLIPRLTLPLIATRGGHRAERGRESPPALRWPDPEREPPGIPAQYPLAAVVHLMGESLAARRWTPQQKKRIRESRVRSTENLVQALAQLTPRPQTLVSASALGFYGERGDEILTERAAAGAGFLAETCQAWEAAASAATTLGIRVVCLRIGLVLGEGGTLRTLLPLFRWGLGGRVGDGHQWMSWIHIDDLIRMIVLALENPRIQGPLNAVAPAPIRNRDFTQYLARAVHRPAWFPVPRWALRWRYGEFGDSLCESTRMEPTAALQAGFEFRFPTLPAALADLIR